MSIKRPLRETGGGVFVSERQVGISRPQNSIFKTNLEFWLSKFQFHASEAHEKMLASGRGKDQLPGQFRRSQNWIGGSRPGNARFVPPPAEEVMDCMGALEKFLHDDPVKTPVLIKAALAHVQFETIHPFLDGNGRVGRLLIPMILLQEQVLHYPLLHLSLFFKEHRARYYELLQQVRLHGDWEAWIDFFLQGVRDIAERTASDINRALVLFEGDIVRIRQLGRPARSCLRIHDHLRVQPMTSIATLTSATGLSPTTVASSLSRLADIGLVRKSPAESMAACMPIGNI